MNEQYNGGLPLKVWVAIVILAFFILMGAMGGMLPESSTGGNTTETHVLSDNEILSRNTVRVLSPDTYIYYNSGNTSQIVNGDRNQVAPGATGGGQCWGSSANAWGPCPAGAPEGSAVP